MAALQNVQAGAGSCFSIRSAASASNGKQLLEPLGIGGLKAGAALPFKRQPDLTVAALAVPAEVPTGFHVLEVHGEPLEAVSDLNRNGLAVDAAALLEVGELGHLHAIEPHFPAHTPGAEGGGLPVVFDETDVVVSWP